MEGYIVTESYTEASALLAEIKEAYQDSNPDFNWGIPNEHPLNNQCLVAYDPKSLLRVVESINQRFEIISEQEARKRGWFFHAYFKGRFARERRLLQEMTVLHDSLIQSLNKPNFPVIRALFLSFISAGYSLNESLNKKAKHDESINNFIKARKGFKGDELISTLLQYMNTEKHGGAVVGQHSDFYIRNVAKVHEMIVQELPPNTGTSFISSEGMFAVVNEGTKDEELVPVGLIHGNFETIMENAPKSHLDQDIQNFSLKEVCDLYLEHFKNLVFDIRQELE